MKTKLPTLFKKQEISNKFVMLFFKKAIKSYSKYVLFAFVYL